MRDNKICGAYGKYSSRGVKVNIRVVVAICHQFVRNQHHRRTNIVAIIFRHFADLPTRIQAEKTSKVRKKKEI